MALESGAIAAAGYLFLPFLVQQIFNKFKRPSGVYLTIDEQEQLFYDLSSLLGENILKQALHILDDWSIVTYYTSDRIRKIVELTSKRNSAHNMRLVPGINYCKCPYFQRHVLRLDSKKEELKQGHNNDHISFSCPHVLARDLHQLLNEKPQEQILSLEQFKFLHDDFYLD